MYLWKYSPWPVRCSLVQKPEVQEHPGKVVRYAETVLVAPVVRNWRGTRTDGRGETGAGNDRFIDGNYDVLLATTIIESGLDIPNANTMHHERCA